MSENITHMVVCDYRLRPIPQMPDICDAFRQAAADHLDVEK